MESVSGSPYSVNASMDATELQAWAQLGLVNVFTAAASVAPWEYAALATLIISALLYHYLDLQFIRHLLFGDSPQLVFNWESPVAKEVFQKFAIDRFWPTPWLCSAHLQTTFLHFFAVSPPVKYRRELLITVDGGTVALDWLDPEPGSQTKLPPTEESEDGTPVVVVVPGLTSDSKSQYVVHAAHAATLRGWRSVVVNHRGLGGVPLTSQRFYNAGWTQDLRFAIGHVKSKFPQASLALIGTSLGANITVKYLGEEGSNTPVQVAASVGNPWDLVVVDRWLNRASKQRLYGQGLIFGLKQFATLHKDSFSKVVDFAHLSKSKSVREFDDRITRILGQYETVDTYYRRCSSAQFLPGVAVPLLAVSARDDPICTSEAIPWDECRANPNIILAVTAHGGHLAFLEGPFARRLWWVKQTMAFLKVVLESPTLRQRKQMDVSAPVKPPFTAVDSAPLVEVSATGKAAAPATVNNPVYPGKPLGSHVFEPINEDGRSTNGMGDSGERIADLDSSAHAQADPALDSAAPDEDEEDEAGETNRGSGTSDASAQVKTTIESRLNENDDDIVEEVLNDTKDAKNDANGLGAPVNYLEPAVPGGSTPTGPHGTKLVVNLRSRAELLALESALSQLLQSVRLQRGVAFHASSNQHGLHHCSDVEQGQHHNSDVEFAARISEEGSGGEGPRVPSMAASPAAVASAVASVLKSSAILMAMVGSLKEQQGQAETVPGVTQRAIQGKGQVAEAGAPSGDSWGTVAQRIVDRNDLAGRFPSDEKLSQLAAVFSRGLGHLEAQNKTNMWLMAYVALAATCPLVGTALLFRMYVRNGGGAGAHNIVKTVLR